MAYLAETFIRQGIAVYLSGLDDRPSHHAPHERVNEIYQTLATVDAKGSQMLADDIAIAMDTAPIGSVVYVLMAIKEPAALVAIRAAVGQGLKVVSLLYDGQAFRKGRAQVETAVDPEFVAEIRGAGAIPIVVPFDANEGPTS